MMKCQSNFALQRQQLVNKPAFKGIKAQFDPQGGMRLDILPPGRPDIPDHTIEITAPSGDRWTFPLVRIMDLSHAIFNSEEGDKLAWLKATLTNIHRASLERKEDIARLLGLAESGRPLEAVEVASGDKRYRIQSEGFVEPNSERELSA